MGRGRGRREARGGRPHLHPEVAAPADEAKLKLDKLGSLMSLKKLKLRIQETQEAIRFRMISIGSASLDLYEDVRICMPHDMKIHDLSSFIGGDAMSGRSCGPMMYQLPSLIHPN